MRKSILVFIFVILAMVTIISANTLHASDPANPSKGPKKFAIPPHAAEIAPGIFHLGTALDKGRVVEGYAIVTPHKKSKKRFAKPGCNNDGICDPGEKKNCGDCNIAGDEEVDTSSCYEYTRGAKWKVEENYIVNTSNNSGLDHFYILDNLEINIGKWEKASGAWIIGNQQSTDEPLEADSYSPDGSNEVYFADVEYANAIGVTIIWGIFGGPPNRRELVEWDQIYDDFDFDWSDDCESEECASKMDFENIATHELGHSVGLIDLYDSFCSGQTMYGYASGGETTKRDLEDGDITGIRQLYK